MQNKQTFHVGEIEVRIEVKPWKVKSNGRNGKWSTVMEATVFKNGFGVRGQSMCVPPDVFDFRFGAELALRKALATEIFMSKCLWTFDNGSEVHSKGRQKIVKHDTRKAIWNEFNKVLPKEK